MNTINQIITSCEWASSRFFIFSENVFDPLVYYSHLFPVVLSLVISGLLFFRNKEKLTNKILFGISVIFSVWCIFDLILWATPNPLDTVFFWSLVNMLEPLIYAGSLYFIYSFVEDKLPPANVQWSILLLLIPVIIFTPTSLNVAGFDLTNCDREAVQGIMIYYSFLVEAVFAIWIIGYGIFKYKFSDEKNKKQVLLCTVGLSLFLFSFAFGNIIGSISVNWVLGQVGLFGLPVFVAFLAILIGRYNSFKTKTFYAEILVIILWILIVSMLFVEDMSILKVILFITLLITIVLGISLIKSVRSQINQKENLQKLKNKVEITNQQLTILDEKKDEFLSFATHQLRSPLTSIKWGLDSIKNKYDAETVLHLERTTDDLIGTVNDLLDISKIEQGGMVIKKEEFELLDFIGRIVEEFRISAEKKGLKLSFEFDNKTCLVDADQTKLRQVFVNLIDNAIKYTKTGLIVVSLKQSDHKALVEVKDTGPGMGKDELANIFYKFIRGAAGKASQSGSGLGLYLAKKIVETHGGMISASSEGLGKGSTFMVSLATKK